MNPEIRREDVPEFMNSGLGPKLPFLLDLAKNRKIQTYMEIGVYGLHTFIEMSKVLAEDALMYGLDLFEQAPKEEGAPPKPPITYKEALKVVSDQVPQSTYLFRGESAMSLKHMWYGGYRIASPVLVFIDGGHSYNTVLQDFLLTLEIVRGERTTIVFDDADWPEVKKAIEKGYSTLGGSLKTYAFGSVGVESLPHGMHKLELMP